MARLNSSFSVCITRQWSLPAVTLTVTLVVSYIVYKYNTKVIGLTTEVNIISTSTKPMYCFTWSMYYVYVSQVSGVKTKENEGSGNNQTFLNILTLHWNFYYACNSTNFVVVYSFNLKLVSSTVWSTRCKDNHRRFGVLYLDSDSVSISRFHI